MREDDRDPRCQGKRYSRLLGLLIADDDDADGPRDLRSAHDLCIREAGQKGVFGLFQSQNIAEQIARRKGLDRSVEGLLTAYNFTLKQISNGTNRYPLLMYFA